MSLAFFISFLLTTHLCTASEPVQLPAIILEASTSEILSNDPIVPTLEGGSINPNSGGGIAGDLSRKWAFSLNDGKKPGELSQIRGYGRSAEDTEVEILGVSLNPPIGGGFSMGTFPQFIWGSYSFRPGPSLSGLDPHANSGRLSLRPWTSEALVEKQSKFMVGENYSSSELNQIYCGFAHNQSTAIIAGMSSGKVRGPSGAFAQRFEVGEWKGKIHALATSTTATSEGSLLLPTPRATLGQKRVISVIQLDHAVGEHGLFKTSLLLDLGSVEYEDLDSVSYSTRDRSQQVGIENVWIEGPWRFGFSTRAAQYKKINFLAPNEISAHIQINRKLESAPWLFEPTLGVTAVRGYNPSLDASLGARYKLDPFIGIFIRGTASKKYPSLQDRFYNLAPIFIGNPHLKPETDFTLYSGVDSKGLDLTNWGVQFYFQDRKEAFIQTSNTVINSGSARLFSVMGWFNTHVTEKFRILGSSTLASSWVEADGESVPYFPKVLAVLGVQANFFSSYLWDQSPLKGEISARGGWGAIAPDRLPADSGVTVEIGLRSAVYSRPNKSITLGLFLDNLTQSRLELTRGYPIQGRSLTASLTGQF
ncbi:MAG: hypothetical protein AABZ55_07140 [Bdellovibrionota bacterium]